MNICPDCGFDLLAGGACGVCGSGRKVEGPAGTGSAAATPVFILSLAGGLAVLALCLGAYFRLAPAEPSVDPAGLVSAEAAVSASAAPAVRAVGSPTPIRVPHAPRFTDLKFPDYRFGSSIESGSAPVAMHNPPLDSRESYLAWMLANTKETAEQLGKKWDRSRALLARDEVRNKAVLEAFLYTPREYFARSYNAKKAYDDTAIPIGHGQTISGPHMVSHMTDSIAPLPGDRILEIGTGSGYQSALLSELTDQVYTIEIVKPLYAETDAIYRKLAKSYPEYSNVRRKNADGYFGWPEYAPFDKIIVTAGIDHIPPPLLAQLAPGGVMVIPVGPPTGQTVLKVVKKPLPGGGFDFERSDIYRGRKVIFVPFTSAQGGRHSLDDTGAAQ